MLEKKPLDPTAYLPGRRWLHLSCRLPVGRTTSDMSHICDKQMHSCGRPNTQLRFF